MARSFPEIFHLFFLDRVAVDDEPRRSILIWGCKGKISIILKPGGDMIKFSDSGYQNVFRYKKKFKTVSLRIQP